MVPDSGGRVSRFRRSVIRHSPATGPSFISQSLCHRYFNRASVIANLQFGRVSKFRRSVIRHSRETYAPVRRRQSSLVSPSLFHRYFNRASVIAKSQFVTAILVPSIKTVYMGNST